MGSFEVICLTSYSDQKTLDKAFATKPFTYITKPFKEIDIYTNVMLCISKIKENTQSGHCSYEPLEKVLRVGDEMVQLSKQEADLFHLCYLSRGHFVPMTIIDYAIWENKEISLLTKRGLFHRLAKKIGKECFEYDSFHGCKVNV